MHTYIHALHYITLHYITLHYLTLPYLSLPYLTLSFITLHYITLHTYIHRERDVYICIYIYIYICIWVPIPSVVQGRATGMSESTVDRLPFCSSLLNTHTHTDACYVVIMHCFLTAVVIVLISVRVDYHILLCVSML